jgi:glycosyltransferase involved in cell wall biosynthesis
MLPLSEGGILYLYKRMTALPSRPQGLPNATECPRPEGPLRDRGGPQPLLGGAQKRVLEMAAHFRRSGWSVYLASHDDEASTVAEEARRCGIQHLAVPFRGGPAQMLACVQTVRRLVRQKGIRIIHSNDRRTAMFASLAAAFTRARHIYTARNVFQNRKITRVFLPAHIVAVSQAVRENLIQDFGVAPTAVEVIYNGISISPSAEGERQAVRTRWGLRASDRIIAFVGSLIEAKGLAHLLTAVSRVVAHVPRLRVLLVGDGKLKPQLHEQSRCLNLQNTVVFCGAQTNVSAYVDLCEFTVMPSLWEGLPGSAIESLLLGKPVVASSVGGLPEIVEDGVSGLIVPPRDSRALTRAILSLLNDPGSTRRMGQRGQQTAADRFTVSRMMSQYEQYYHRALQDRNGHSPAG